MNEASLYHVICAIIVLSASALEDKNTYYFSSPEDKITCKTVIFEKITTSRRFSKNTKMTQISADQCCRMRGMNLYSTEMIDEPAGFASLASGKLGVDTWFWTSANNFKEKFKYRWEYGQIVGTIESGFAKWDLHEWDTDEPNTTSPGLCVVAKPIDKKVIMKTVDCKNETYPFMCEMQPQKGGASITNAEMLRCVNSEIETIPGFPTLRFFEDTGRWPVANFCCQRNGWALMDNVHPKGEPFYTAVTEHDFGQPFEGMDYTSVWTSGNDLCEFRRFKWACGEDGIDMNWFGDESSQNPDNLKGMEDCVEYHNANESIGFAGNDITCDVENFIICDTNPKCSVPEQYPCGAKDPRTYDIQDLLEEDASECSTVTFTEKNSNDTNYPNTFHISDKKVSWFGAETCCTKNDMTLAAFYKIEDKYEASKIVLAMEFATGEFEPIEMWIAATNWNLSKRASVVWPNGDAVAEFMLPKVILHSDMYPVCGKLMDLPTKGINILTANCLDKNLFMCMKKKELTATDGPNSLNSIQSKEHSLSHSGSLEIGEMESGDLKNDFVESDKVEIDEVPTDQVENDQVVSDEEENDEVENDEVENDEVENDEVENDEVENDEVENGGGEDDEVENDEPESDDVENYKVENDEVENGGGEDDEVENDEPENDEVENDKVEHDEEKRDKGMDTLNPDIGARYNSDNIPSASDPDQALLYNKTLSSPASKDQEYTVVKVKRDRCPSFMLKEYSLKCPKSSSNISAFAKPTSTKTSKKDSFQLQLQNKRILGRLINLGIYGTAIPKHAPELGFNLLATSVFMYSKICPIVPLDFLQNAFKIFHDLHWSTSQGRSENLVRFQYKWILKLLRKCKAYIKPVHVRTESCGEMIFSVENCTNFVCTSPRLEFKLYGTDPVVDAMWKVYEMIHSICFPAFEESYRMFHKYAQSIMDLWTIYIRFRWFNQVSDDDYWKRALGPSYEVHLVNMERCNQASIMQTFFHIRLPRNTLPERPRLIGGDELH